MTATLRQIVDDAQTIVGEVSGAGVQTYGEDAMMQDAVRAFNLLFKKYDWDQYMSWLRLELDGTTGLVTTNVLEDVLDYEDIRAVHRDGDRNALAMLPKSYNPYSSSNTGTGIRGWSALSAAHALYATKKIIIQPVTSIGFINVHCKIYPYAVDDLSWDSTFYLDKDMLVYATAFMTMVGDGLNPDGADLARNFMESKFNDITNALAGRTMSLSGGSHIPSEWR